MIECKNRDKDKKDNASIKRYILTSTFDRPYDDKLNIEWVKHNINHYSAYRHYKIFKDDKTIEESIEKCENIKRAIYNMNNNNKENPRLLGKKCLEFETSSESSEEEKEEYMYRKKTINKTIHQKIHYDKTFHKLYHCLQFIKHAGFKSIGDMDKIKIDYPSVHLYCRENEENIRAVFERSKIMVWSDEDTDMDPNEKMALSKYVNQKLESMLGIRLTPTSKGSLKYEITDCFII